MLPTFTGLLLIGKKERLRELVPTSESAIQILSGTDIKVNESFTLPLLAAFERISDVFSAWNGSQEMEDGLFRITIPDVDNRAFRESLVNAYSHRDYTRLGRVRVQLTDEGMTISNPGGFIEGINIKNLLDAEPHGRNPALADALKRVGLAERTGRGIDRIFEGSLLYGRLLPDYSATTDTRVNLFIPKSIPDKSFVKMISEEQLRIGRSLPIHALLIMNSLKQLHRASVHDIANDINLEDTKVKIVIESLVEAGIVEAAGTGRGRFFTLSLKVYKSADSTVAYVRQTDIDKLRYTELILKLAETQGYVTRGKVAEMLRISPPQAYRILAALASENRLRLEGKGRYAKYYLF